MVTRSRTYGLYARLLKPVAAFFVFAASLPAQAIVFDWDIGDGVSGSLNTAITFGAAWRMEDQSSELIGFGNLDPTVCEVRSCQGVWQGDTQPNSQRLGVRGAFSANQDDGNLNYDKYDVTQSPLKILQDLNLTYKDYGFFMRYSAFYDFTNNDFREYHPNRVLNSTPANGPSVIDTGFRDAVEDVLGIPLPLPQPGVLGTPTIKFGEVVRNKRRDEATLDQIGADIDLLDAYVYGFFPVGEDRELQLKVGRQTVNWGESTVLVINSLNQINPPNVNNLFRVGADLSEVFTPVGMIFGAINLTDNVNLEVFYQYEWEPVEVPAPGSFLSFIDLGTDNAATDGLTLGFGGPFEDARTEQGHPGDNVLSTVTNTTGHLFRLKDNEPEDGGQYGFALRYYAEWLNDGTELAFYAMNYHSRLPYASFYATDASCSRREGNDAGIDSKNIIEFATVACPDLPLVYQAAGLPTTMATSNAIPFDTVRLQLEYPEDIQLYGVSFNTAFGDLALQGEVAYRPDLPIQVDAEDLIFAAFQPVLGRCHNLDGGGFCGDIPGVGTLTSGQGTHTLAAPIGGDFTGAARSFPSYVLAYRGGTHEEVAPNAYIRGWENFESYQFNLGSTYIYKPPPGIAKLLGGMDQAILLFELGAQWVPDMPDVCELPLEAPGTFTHPGPGADGTGTPEGGGRQCLPGGGATIAERNADGSDGLRFNPTQQLDGYPDELSWGYRAVFLLRWESIVPGISLEPLIIFGDDVRGTSPGPGESFLEGRQIISIDANVRYYENWQFHLGYTWFRGAEPFNQLSDRDYAQAYVRYLF